MARGWEPIIAASCNFHNFPNPRSEQLRGQTAEYQAEVRGAAQEVQSDGAGGFAQTAAGELLILDLLGLSCEFTTNNSHFQSEHRVNDIDPEEIEDLLNELEDYSDYGPDLDTASVGSTPKPSLRPFFSSSRSLIRDTLDKPPYSIMEKPELGSDHLSDDSSKGS